MVDFLKYMDIKTWKVVVKGQKHHVITFQDGTSTLNPKVDWENAKEDEALGNSKALNATFNGVDKDMFILINTCIESKESWEILIIAHEGTYKVRMSRLQLLTTKVENE